MNTAAYDWLRPARGTEDIPLGTLVRDQATGRVGVLQDVTPFADLRQLPGVARHAQVLAFLRPVGGGREWATEPDRIVRLEENGGGMSE